MESADEEIIDKINKGCRPYQNIESLKNLNNAGIAVFPMTFVGFPGENFEQAMRTVKFLNDNRYLFAILPRPSNFYLEGSSLISKNYKDYNVEFKEKFENLEITNGWLWKAKGISNDEYIELNNYISKVCDGENCIISRPFIGVDTPHSMMYLHNFGNDTLKEFLGIKKLKADNEVYSAFDVSEIQTYISNILENAKQLYLTGKYPTMRIADSLLYGGGISFRKKDCLIPEEYMDVISKLDFWEDNVFSRNIENNALW